MQTNESIPRLISFNKFLEEMGVTNTTGWRWRKRGVLQTVNVYGRLYVTEETIREFHQKAVAGAFAKEISPKKNGAIRETSGRPTGAGNSTTVSAN